MEAFIPSLFHGLREGTPVRGVTRLPMKQAGLVLPYLTKTASENWTASCVITGNLVAVLRGRFCQVWEGQARLFHGQASDPPNWCSLSESMEEGRNNRFHRSLFRCS